MNKKQTSKPVAIKASQILRDGRYGMQILLERYAYSEISGTFILI